MEQNELLVCLYSSKGVQLFIGKHLQFRPAMISQMMLLRTSQNEAKLSRIFRSKPSFKNVITV